MNPAVAALRFCSCVLTRTSDESHETSECDPQHGDIARSARDGHFRPRRVNRPPMQQFPHLEVVARSETRTSYRIGGVVPPDRTAVDFVGICWIIANNPALLWPVEKPLRIVCRCG